MKSQAGRTSPQVESESAKILAFPSHSQPTCTNYVIVSQHFVPEVGHFSRTFQVHEGMTVAELKDTLLTCYAWNDAPQRWSLRAKKDGKLSIYGYSELSDALSTPLRDALGDHGVASLLVDDFQFYLSVVDTVERQWDMPDAQCDGGDFIPDLDQECASDSMHLLLMDQVMAKMHPHQVPQTPNLDSINAVLSCDFCAESTLEACAPDLADLLRRPELAQYLPLLHTLDLERQADIPEQLKQTLLPVPLEEDELGRAAAWSRILGHSMLSDPETADHISIMFMSALGYTNPDTGGELSAEDIKALSDRTGSYLQGTGLQEWSSEYADNVAMMNPEWSVVTRLEAYRFLLQGSLR